MRVLQISPRKPYPPSGGGEIVTYNTIKYLSLRNHDITLVSIVDKSEDIPELQEYCEWVPVEKDTRNKIFGILGNLLSAKPYTISKYHSGRVMDVVRRELREKEFDIVHLDGLHVAHYGAMVKREFELPVVLGAHNVETKIMQRFYRSQGNPFIKLYAYYQYRKLYSYEARLCGVFDRCLMITGLDERRLREMNPNVKTAVVPAGVDTSYFYPLNLREEPCSIVSVASMDWLPNVESILWFYYRVFPIVKKSVPEARLYVVGRNPPGAIKDLEGDDVVVTGFVDDVREWMARGRVFIVPLKTGSGMRVKILNAMAMAKPVVSTSVGCEGIGAVHGRSISVADSPEEFAARIVELFNEREKRERMATAGLELVDREYRWEKIAERMEWEYLGVLPGRDKR